MLGGGGTGRGGSQETVKRARGGEEGTIQDEEEDILQISSSGSWEERESRRDVFSPPNGLLGGTLH